MTVKADITTTQRLAVVKHLAAGKTQEVAAALTHLDRSDVVEIARHHGYPSTELLNRAVALLEAKLDRENGLTEHPQARAIAAAEARRAAQPRPPAMPTTNAEPLTKPDEIRVLINTSKDHPSKRVQAAGERVLAAVERLRDLIREDEEKHAAKRRQEAQKVAAKAEVERLTKALADAKEKLRGPRASGTSSSTDGGGVSSAEVRSWARENGVECPAVGRVPAVVRSAYDEAHKEAV